MTRLAPENSCRFTRASLICRDIQPSCGLAASSYHSCRVRTGKPRYSSLELVQTAKLAETLHRAKLFGIVIRRTYAVRNAFDTRLGENGRDAFLTGKPL
jgi:hypothetical protein